MHDDKRLILCIDDDPDILSFLETVLQAEGFGFLGAASAEEGLQLFKSSDPAAVIVDLSRPAGRVRREVHRLGTALVVPAVGKLAGAPSEYRYLNASLDKLPAPERMFSAGPLELEKLWRMGPLGFVYGALLRRSPSR